MGDEDWKGWDELQNSPEMKALVENANEKLKQAAEAKKGSGKGKKGNPPQGGGARV